MLMHRGLPHGIKNQNMPHLLLEVGMQMKTTGKNMSLENRPHIFN